MSVKDKVIVITGGAQGVGRYAARTFAAAGAKVAVADIAPFDNVIKEVSALEADLLPIRTDITDEKQVESLMDQVYRRWGRIDVLMQPAGIVTHFSVGAPRWPRIRSMPSDFFRRVIDTNLVGTFHCTKHVLPYMESLNDGHIICFGQGNVSEQRNPNARPSIGSATYNVSKVAIRAFARHVADEEREFNICVMSTSPDASEGPGAQARSEAPRSGPGIPGGGGGLVTDDSPEWTRNQGRTVPMVQDIGDKFVIIAEAPMEFSGHQVRVRGGQIEIASD
jgi:NAD(P)-dependent dehydrogenase (short-subunit alcohol dehydrogenase family)